METNTNLFPKPTLVMPLGPQLDYRRLWKAAVDQRWNVCRRNPHRNHYTPKYPCIYADEILGPQLASELGVNLLNPPEDWLVTAPPSITKRSVRITTLGRARLFAESSRPFKISPVTEIEGKHLQQLDDDTSVILEDQINYAVEFRCFVLYRTIETFSVYTRSGKPSSYASENEREGMQLFVSSVLKSIPTPLACVLDIGFSSDLGWAVIRIKEAWSARLYGCLPSKALNVILAASCLSSGVEKDHGG